MKKLLALAVVALMSTATVASARPGNGWHNGGGHHGWHGGHQRGGWGYGPAIGLGVGALALGTGDYCWRNVETYDRYGNVVLQRRWVC